MLRKILNATTLFLTLVVLAIGVTAGVLYAQLRTDSVSAILAEEGTMRALLVAHEENEPFLSVLLFFDNTTGRAAVLDIPSSVGAVLRPLGRVDGIGALFDAENPEEYRRQVESLTGVSIPLVFLFETARLVDFIDLLGGMDLFIISDYRDPDGSDPMLLPSGTTRLDGEKSVRYLKEELRNDTDAEQAGRRQTFVQALLREVQANAALLVHRDVASVRDRLVVTETESRGITAFFRALGRIDPDRLVRRRIQGTVRRVEVGGIPRDLLFPHFEGQWLKQSVQQIQQTLADHSEAEQEMLVSLEILNGTSRTGLARRTSELFESFGFQVLNVGNAESSGVEHTVILDRRGIGDLAERVAAVIDGRRVLTEVKPDSDVDVTIILGGDFDGTRVRATGQ